MQENERQTMLVNMVRQGWHLQLGRMALFSLGNVFFVWSAMVLGSIGICDASTLTQTNFENGEMGPWEIFVTHNGTVGGAGLPTMAPFETATEGQPSMSLKFKVGQVRYDPDDKPEQGGGLVIQIMAEAGMLDLSAQIAATYSSPKDKRNLAGGLFEWLVDDQVIASHDIGPIENGRILRHLLKASHHVKAGVHTLRLRITRPFTSSPGQHAPFQFVDDLLVRLSANP